MMRFTITLLPLLLAVDIASAATPAKAPVAPVAPPSGKAVAEQCVSTCSDQQDVCATTEAMDPGADRKSLCASRFRICIERCDPHYLNYHDTIDAHPVKDPNAPAAAPLTEGQRCIESCGAKSQTCTEAGNGSQGCASGRAACVSRCNLPATR